MAKKILRRDMLRSMAQIMAAGTALGLLSACTTKPDAAPTPSGSASNNTPKPQQPAATYTGKLELLLGSHMDYLHNLRPTYKNSYNVEPGLEQVTSPDLRTKLVAAFAARRSAWDVTFTTARLNYEFAQNKWIKDLTVRADKYFSGKKVLENAFTSALYQGKKFAVPVTIGAPIMYWNKELAEKAGLDPTAPVGWHSKKNSWDDFLRYAKAMTGVHGGVQHYGYTDAWAAQHIMFMFGSLVQMHGGQVLDADGNPVMNSAAGIASVEKMYDLLHTHKVVDPAVLTYTWVFDASPAFLKGERGMFMTWPFIANVAQDASKSSVAGKIGWAPNYAVETSASLDGSEFLAIPASAENEEEAWRFIELATSVEAQKKQGTGTAWVPIYEDLLNDKEVVANQQVAPIVALSYKYPVGGFYTADYARWTDILSAELHEVLAKKKKPKEALDDTVKKIKDSRK